MEYIVENNTDPNVLKASVGLVKELLPEAMLLNGDFITLLPEDIKTTSVFVAAWI